jgi:hypothetical protein
MTATKEPPSVASVKAVIQAFFDAINAEDTKALQAKFHPEADLTIIRQDPALPPPVIYLTWSRSQDHQLLILVLYYRNASPGPPHHQTPESPPLTGLPSRSSSSSSRKGRGGVKANLGRNCMKSRT